MRKLYHGTSIENFNSMVKDGVIKTSYFSQCIYCCQSKEDVLKFMYIYQVTPCIILEIEVPDEDVVETFDHSPVFFQCRCFGITKAVEIGRNVKCAHKFKFTENEGKLSIDESEIPINITQNS